MLNRSGGRDRFRRDYPSRFEDKGSSGRSTSSNPPSRHLWVGNLSHSITENDLARHFLQFGPLESVAFQPGRSYAFINFRRDEDAIDALNELQGFPVAGNPLRVEFAKADKPPSLTRDDDYSWDERSSGRRGSPFSSREFRGRRGSPEPPYPDKSKLTDKNPEPSEVLWIGFPSQLNVDDLALRKAFSPFGEIEKITTFPGRSYAFVRFRSLTSARRARDTLQGKLFGNPRVHICFAKSEAGSSSSGRFSMNTPSSPFYTSSGRHGSTENLRQDRSVAGFSGDRGASSPIIFPKWDLADPDTYDSDRRGSSRASGFSSYEQRRVGEKVPPLGILQDSLEHSVSPSRDRQAHLGAFPQRYPQKHALFEDPRDYPDDIYYQHDTKKLKTGSLPPEKELPEYPLSDLERQRHPFLRLITDLPQHEILDKRIDAGPVVHRQTFDPRPNSPFARSDRDEHWKPSDSFHMGPSALQSYSTEKRRLTPEPGNSSLTEWKWEGTIAKGGTHVCRARCFPVGKVLDIMLPEFLDCTARTGLDMLSKHYYQAAGAWVVFFVPESDVDIEYYNEFMHYLEEKRRAAVAKLDDRNTLFLVPPSDFSEKVLKVPGKLSISGVVLRLDHPGSTQGSMHNQNEAKDGKLLSYHGDALYPKPVMPSARSPPPFTSTPELGTSGMSNPSFLGNKTSAAMPASVSGSAHAIVGASGSHDGRRGHDYPVQQQNHTSGPNWSANNLQPLINRNFPLQQSNGVVEPLTQDHQLSIQRPVLDVDSNQRMGENKSSLQEIRPLDSLSLAGGSLQQEQLAQLAASLLEHQRQSGSSLSVSPSDDPRQTQRVNGSDTSSRPSQKYPTQNNSMNPELATSQYGQVLQLQRQQQMSNVPQGSQMVQREPQRVANGNQQPLTGSNLQQDAEADPQKRLQATLQLAAVLLQQIQQGKGS